MARFLVARAAKSDSVFGGSDPTAFETSNPLRLFIIQAAIIIIVIVSDPIRLVIHSIWADLTG